MSWQVGDTYRATIEVRDEDGNLADPPSLTLTIRDPEDARTTRAKGDADVIEDATGKFHSDVDLTAAGRWVVQWTAPGQVEGAELYVDPAPVDEVLAAWCPTPRQVAAILHTRTRGPADTDPAISGEQGEFTAITRPTYTQVRDLIKLAVGELSGMMGGRTPCSTELRSAAATAATYRAAQLVEVAYFTEQTEDENTAFKALESMWRDSIASTVSAVITNCPLPPAPEGSGASAGSPIGRVPARIPTTWAEQY